MHVAVAIPLAICLLAGASLSIWIAIREYRRDQTQTTQSEANWPFEFPVHWLDYYLGPKLARYWRFGQSAIYAPVFLLGVFDFLFVDGNTAQFMLMNLLFFVSAATRGFLPLPCQLGDRGIRFQDQLYPWDTIRRWNVNERRVQFVASRATNRTMLFTLEIPLNGLSPSLRPWLNEQIAEHMTRGALVGLDTH